MATESQERSPYVGPRPFERQDRDLFFGRDREASEVLSLIIAHRVLLLYAQSGAGKTSLLNAGLIPLLEEEGFEVIPVARVRGLIPEDIKPEEIPNLYVFNTLMSWAEDKTDPKRLAQMSLAGFLKEREHPTDEEGLLSPCVIIFDQFEELFAFYPERWRERERFFEQVDDALEEDPLLRVVFVIREDYIAQLDPYAPLLPEKLRTRFRLERLHEGAALAAVTGPLRDTRRSFAEGVAEKLVENLLKVRVQAVTGETIAVTGEFVEPLQLQVVCQGLWRNLPPDVTVITQDHLQAFGDVKQALSGFYERCTKRVSQETGVKEGTLRVWFEHTLITPAGTRGTVYRGQKETGGIPNVAVDALENLHLIRGEWRAGARWYELTHDLFIEPIQESRLLLLQPGETILNGQYTIEKHLGSGGQVQVYLARHPIFDQMAVKRLHRHIAAKAEGLARFERELRITNQLGSEHVISIRNLEKDPARDEWFSVMEYANAGSLKDKLATEAPLPVVEAIDLAITLCQALAYVHQYSYVHGDLKPGNILFHTMLGGKRILKLSDFGSAFPPVQAGVLPLPSGLKAALTLIYVSPERLEASNPEDTAALTVDVDQRADIYSIGVILYEMLTGHPPFWEPMELLQKIKYQPPPEPKKQRREILRSLNALVMKALAKDPADRFASVDEMQTRLKEVLQEEKVRLAKLARLRPLADQALGKEEWGQASDLLYQILGLAPDDPDALQKLKIAQDQQYLMNLRHHIPRKMNEGLWQEAKGLVGEALEIAPDDTTLTTWQKKIDGQLAIIEILEAAEEAAKGANWPKVIRLCLRALELDHRHVEASSLLSRAQAQIKIATLRKEAETLRQQGDKQGELERLKALYSVVPTDDEVNARIKELQKTIELESYYAQGKQAYDKGRWEAAVEALKEVVAFGALYRDVAPMLLEAQERLDQMQDVERDAKRRQEFQKLFDKSEELIHSKQWRAARETLKKIQKDKHYRDVIAREELLIRLFYVLGRQYAEAGEWYQAKCCFAKVLAYTPIYRDVEQQLAIAQSNNRLKRNYRIKRTLGSGGTSQVDYAVDMNRGQRDVSLKYLKASYVIDQEAAISQRFRRQAQRCMALDHLNIVEIHAVEMRGMGEDKQEVDVPVVVMEYTEGQNLAEFLKRTQGVSERRAIEFTRQLCLALQHAHERDILHLDIKPSNILIRTDGVLLLSDFAYLSPPHGTRGYHSPEQVRRSAELDERTDIFSAGKVLYALLTDKLSVEGPLDEEDPSFQEITPILQAVIRKATAPNPADRYQSAQEMLEALQKAKAALPFHRKVGYAWEQTVEAAKTWKGVLAIIGVLLTFIVVPVLTAEDNTPLARIREAVTTHLYGAPTPIPRSIGETEFIVNGVTFVDVTQPHYVTDTRQISIEVRARDTEGGIISDDEILCQWAFAPPLPEQAIGEEGGCKISYPTPEGLDSQLMTVVVQGKGSTGIAGMSAKSINIILKR